MSFRVLFQRLGVLVLVVSSSGCVAWPERATGGLAELYRSESPRLNELERRFEQLARGRAADYAPAALLEARDLLVRAKREHAGGLLADSEVTAARLDAVLAWVEARWPAQVASRSR